jgi:hypothetical protein
MIETVVVVDNLLNYELETRLIKPEIRFPKVKNMGSIYSPMTFESSKDFKVNCQLFLE